MYTNELGLDSCLVYLGKGVVFFTLGEGAEHIPNEGSTGKTAGVRFLKPRHPLRSKLLELQHIYRPEW